MCVIFSPLYSPGLDTASAHPAPPAWPGKQPGAPPPAQKHNKTFLECAHTHTHTYTHKHRISSSCSAQKAAWCSAICTHTHSHTHTNYTYTNCLHLTKDSSLPAHLLHTYCTEWSSYSHIHTYIHTHTPIARNLPSITQSSLHTHTHTCCSSCSIRAPYWASSSARMATRRALKWASSSAVLLCSCMSYADCVCGEGEE